MSKKRDNIYIYMWEEFNTVYVGRTVNPKSRHYAHKHRETEPTYQFSSTHGVEHPKMIIIENDLPVEEGIKREKFWINYYRCDTDYNVLNKLDGGQIGSFGGIKWTKDTVFEEAKKYRTRAELKYNNGSVYTAARTNGWLNELFGIEKNIKPIRKWTKEAVLNESKKYHKKKEFKTSCPGGYKAALKNGWLKYATWFKKVDYFTKWTREAVFEESKKYTSRKLFKTESPGAYHAALKNNWLDEMDWIAPRVKWNKDAVFNEGKKYATRGLFKKGNRSAYQSALKNKWLDEMYWFIPYKDINNGN